MIHIEYSSKTWRRVLRTTTSKGTILGVILVHLAKVPLEPPKDPGREENASHHFWEIYLGSGAHAIKGCIVEVILDHLAI